MYKSLKDTPEIKPIGKRLVVEVTQAQELKTEGGILIPQEAIKNNAKEAIVVAFDDEHVQGVELGQKVVLLKFRSQALNHNGREFRIVDAVEDLLGTIPNDMNASFTVNTR